MTRQKNKTRNFLANNMSGGIKLSKAQLSKINQSGRFPGAFLGKLASALMKLARILYQLVQKMALFKEKCIEEQRRI